MKKLLSIILVLVLIFAVAAPAFAQTQSKVTVKYVTGDNNKTIAKNKTLTGTPGKHFSVKVADIKGYTFIGFSDGGKNDFVFPQKSMTILVHYAKTVKATIKYEDTYGNEISPSKTIRGYEDMAYAVDSPYISGYSLKQVQDPRNGVFGASNHTIHVIYSGGGVAPVRYNTAHLVVRSVNAYSGAVLLTIVDQTVTLPIRIDLSGYGHYVPGYTFCGVTVNGVRTNANVLQLSGDTVVNYLYTMDTPTPIDDNASLYAAAVDVGTGDVITVLRNGNVPRGTKFYIDPRSFNGYALDHVEVNGNYSYNSFVTVNYDTNVIYYYQRLLLTDPITTPLTTPVTSPVTDPVTTPVVDPATAPVTDPLPVVPTTDPVSDAGGTLITTPQ